MITAEGCRLRRELLRQRLAARGLAPETLLLADPIHLRYLAGLYVDPFSLGADFGGLLAVRRDGSATLVRDSRLPPSAKFAHADEVRVVPWYDGRATPPAARRAALRPAVAEFGGKIHDALDSDTFETVSQELSEMRRSKAADEIETLRTCMAAGEAGMAWAKRHVAAGMSELDAYQGCSRPPRGCWATRRSCTATSPSRRGRRGAAGRRRARS
jgi:Xaa-Pro aminopeptidase